MTRPEKPIEEIIRDFKQGQDREENARLLFGRYYGFVTGFFRRKGFSREDSEELTQTVFISVYSNLGYLRQESKFENWLCKVAMNVYKNELERRGAKKRAAAEVSIDDGLNGSEETHLPDPSVGTPETDMLRKETLEKVRAALQQLPNQMRRCLILKVDEELSYQEIGLAMGISVNTVSAHLHQARKMLEAQLGSYFDEFGV